MARLIERTFNPDLPLVARRPFTAAGRRYRAGEPFPWRDLRISVRQAGLLFNGGHVIHVDDKPQPRPASEPVIEIEVQDEDIHHIAVTAASASESDGLDEMTMTELRALAEQEGAPTRRSREDQIEAIREHRRDDSA